MGARWFWFVFLVSHFSIFLIIGNTFLYSPYTESVLPITIIVKQSPCSYLNPWALYIFSLPLFPLRSGSKLWWSSAAHPSKTTITCKLLEWRCTIISNQKISEANMSLYNNINCFSISPFFVCIHAFLWLTYGTQETFSCILRWFNIQLYLNYMYLIL